MYSQYYTALPSVPKFCSHEQFLVLQLRFKQELQVSYIHISLTRILPFHLVSWYERNSDLTSLSVW